MKKFLVALNMIPQIGYKRLKSLITHFGGIYENIFKIPPKTLSEIAGLKKPIDYNPAEIMEKAEKEILFCINNKIDIITINDKNYPPLLLETDSPPIVLYCKGDFDCLNRNCVSVVGTRNPTAKGKQNSFEISALLSKNGITIVSGFAKGIDTCAHQGALNSGGKTCAVLGNGIDIIYPKENEKLYNEIINSGCIISEFPIDTPPMKMYFPRRNRIIAGLSKACIMVQGAKDSGSLITSNMAFEMNRNVFAYPGYVGNPRYEGTNKLIKKNIASLITSNEDLLNELSNLFHITVKNQLIKEETKEKNENLSEVEKKVYNLLDSCNQKHVDYIIEETQIATGTVIQALLSLELKGLITQKPGKYFIRS